MPMAVVLGDVNRPLPGLIAPPDTFVVHVKDGCAVKVLPNWSYPVAVNCCAAPAFKVANCGPTEIEVRV